MARLSLAALSPRARIGLVVVIILVTLHFTLSATSTSYGRVISESADRLYPAPVHGLVPDAYYVHAAPDPWLRTPRENATLLMVTRSSAVQGAVDSMRHLEDRFNRRRRYPWVFLSEQPLDETFRRRVRLQTDADVFFGEIPKEQWGPQPWINETLAAANREKMTELRFVPHADSVSHRNMYRYHSGFFFQHPLLSPYKWYWRVEPSADFTCDIPRDPFTYMVQHNKTYGFTLAPTEFAETAPSLWAAAAGFARAHPEHVARDNARRFVSEDGESYNMCHFWSNFEIGDLDFWRSPAYAAFFAALDATGGFYYERWSDAPVHTLALALLLPKDALHFFAPIGYEYGNRNHCPTKKSGYDENHCQCGPTYTFDNAPGSCLDRYAERVSPSDMDQGW